MSVMEKKEDIFAELRQKFWPTYKVSLLKLLFDFVSVRIFRQIAKCIERYFHG